MVRRPGPYRPRPRHPKARISGSEADARGELGNFEPSERIEREKRFEWKFLLRPDRRCGGYGNGMVGRWWGWHTYILRGLDLRAERPLGRY